MIVATRAWSACMNQVCGTLVRIFGSSCNARAWAAADASSSPPYRHVVTRPASSSGSAALARATSRAHRVARAAEIHFELRVELVRERQIGIEFERPTKRFLRLVEALARRRWRRYFAIT